MALNTATQKEALKTLDGMERIIRTERLIHGSYALDNKENACGKNKYCAVGAAVAGTGCRFATTEKWASLVATDPDGRDDSECGAKRFLAKRPGLAVALAELSRAAAKRLRKRGWRHLDGGLYGDEDAYGHWRHSVTGATRTESTALEVYFEGELMNQPGRKELLKVIASARKRIEKAA